MVVVVGWGGGRESLLGRLHRVLLSFRNGLGVLEEQKGSRRQW